MLKAILATSLVACSANASPPITDTYHPEQHSYVHDGILATSQGKIPIMIRNFGMEDCAVAQKFGVSMADFTSITPDAAKRYSEQRAIQRYPSSVYEQHCFVEQARQGFVAERSKIPVMSAKLSQ
jgi:hypothetical protein